MADASSSKSCGPRPANEKFAMPNTRRMRSRASDQPASGRSSISIRPITERTAAIVEAGQRDLQIADEHLHEPRAVPSLERQFLVVDDDRVHELASAASPARWPLRTALSIVAGSPVSIQSPARNRPRTGVVVAGRRGCPGASEKVARGSRTTVARSSLAVRAPEMPRAVRRARPRSGPRWTERRPLRRRSTPATGAMPMRRRPAACRTPTASSGRAGRRMARRGPADRTRDSPSRSASERIARARLHEGVQRAC